MDSHCGPGSGAGQSQRFGLESWVRDGHILQIANDRPNPARPGVGGVLRLPRLIPPKRTDIKIDSVIPAIQRNQLIGHMA